MPFLMTARVGLQCVHGVRANVTPTQGRVLVDKALVATVSDQIVVAPGCPFQIPFGVGTKPQPCVQVKWGLVSTRVMVDRKFVLLQAAPGAGAGLCLSVEGIPQGPPVVTTLQIRSTGT